MGTVIIGLSSSMWGQSVEGYEARLRLCVLEEGFHVLHWKMLSWLVFVGYVRGLRFRWEWIARFDMGGCTVEGLWSLVRDLQVRWECVGGGLF